MWCSDVVKRFTSCFTSNALLCKLCVTIWNAGVKFVLDFCTQLIVLPFWLMSCPWLFAFTLSPIDCCSHVVLVGWLIEHGMCLEPNRYHVQAKKTQTWLRHELLVPAIIQKNLTIDWTIVCRTLYCKSHVGLNGQLHSLIVPVQIHQVFNNHKYILKRPCSNAYSF